MTATDAGPLIALVDKSQKQRLRCHAVLPTLSAPMLTTWPCFTEAMYFAYGAGGWPMQHLLWRYVETGALRLYTFSESEIARMQTLMKNYRDTPMDMADASLTAACETLNLSRVFTLDSDFYVYRLANGTALEVVP